MPLSPEIVEKFAPFLEEYFRNVRVMLPESYRARQLEAGGATSEAVYFLETKFLLAPFKKALNREIEKAKEEQRRVDADLVKTWHIKKGGFSELEHKIRNAKT